MCGFSSLPQTIDSQQLCFILVLWISFISQSLRLLSSSQKFPIPFFLFCLNQREIEIEKGLKPEQAIKARVPRTTG
ncbi:hypothetical protein CRYUN_Cryun01aG0147300 [Craigia yunnanensis]